MVNSNKTIDDFDKCDISKLRNFVRTPLSKSDVSQVGSSIPLLFWLVGFELRTTELPLGNAHKCPILKVGSAQNSAPSRYRAC